MRWLQAAHPPVGRIVAQLLLAAVSGSPAHAQARQVALGADSVVARPRGEVLSRRVSVDLVDASLESALRVIAQRAELRLSYSSDIVPVARRVSVQRDKAPVGDVLRDVLRGTDLDYVVTPSGYLVLVRSPVWHPDGDSSAATISSQLGRASLRPQVMDRVIVMGTPAMGAPERELTTAVTVLTGSQVMQQGAGSMEDLFRTGIPGVVAWDLGISGPFAQIGSVRGSSSFTSNYLKTYVDGVELASPYLLFAIDPYSIERIEVIRGPQGSALYGSDAISGVVQVITRRGSPGAQWKPRGDLLLSGGGVQSAFVDGMSGVQRHSGFLSTGGSRSSLGVGGTFEQSGEVAPGGSAGYRGTFGGFRHLLGPVKLEGAMRYADVRFDAPANPLFQGQALNSSVRPLVESQRIENETYGLTLDFQPFVSWRQTLVVGIDRHAGSIPPQREPATVADALLGATRERVSKGSIRYSTALRLADGPSGSATVTLGVEHASLDRERLGFRADVFGSGTGLAALYNDHISNTGAFAQFKFDVASAFFLTAGLRGENNSNFGRNVGTAWSPMLGMAYTGDAGASSYKLRWAYGRGIRPPPSSARRQIATVTFRQVANLDLEPEVQAGFEGGVEVYASDRASISVTAYRQEAEGLVQQVILARPISTAAQRAIQYQNVGRIENRGVEVEGAARAGQLRAGVSFALTDSRVRALSQTYSGDLAVGDRVPEVPSSSGMASLSWEHARLRATVGASYIGSWQGYDWVDYYQGQVGTRPERDGLRNYIITYPSLLKPYVSLARSVGSNIEWYGRVDNLANEQRNERDNLQVTAGRTVTVGLRLSRP